ncbi:MAG: 2-amino-4-hydroxy-6-hydroxymethyldihydropteridine diphosphokinase [Paracoccaceae bacterium]
MDKKHCVDTSSGRQTALIALGGNLPSVVGPPVQTIGAAISDLVDAGIELRSISRFYETPCFPVGAGPDFANAVISVYYEYHASELLTVLHEIEAKYLRQREQRWGTRTLDLDLLALGEKVFPDAMGFRRWRNLSLADQVRSTPGKLILPHPRIQDRAFVLAPLCDVAPDWIHPVLGVSAAEMLSAIPDADVVSVNPL